MFIYFIWNFIWSKCRKFVGCLHTHTNGIYVKMNCSCISRLKQLKKGIQLVVFTPGLDSNSRRAGMNRTFGSEFVIILCRHRHKTFRKCHEQMKVALSLPGFNWDNESIMITMEPFVWDDLIMMSLFNWHLCFQITWFRYLSIF